MPPSLQLLLLLLPLLANGQTIGAKGLRFRYTHERLFRKMTKRWLAIFLVFAAQFAAQLLRGTEIGGGDAGLVWLDAALTVAGLLLTLLLWSSLLIHGIIVFMSRGRRRFFFDEVAGVRVTRKNAR